MDETLRAECAVPVMPADPVLPSQALAFSEAQGTQTECELTRARALLATIDKHNEAAERVR